MQHENLSFNLNLKIKIKTLKYFKSDFVYEKINDKICKVGIYNFITSV